MGMEKQEACQLFIEQEIITYFISDGDYTKIGKTTLNNLDNRLNTLQTGNARPLVIELIIFADAEKAFHEYFREVRLNGEWYILSASYIKEMVAICNERRWKYKREFFQNVFNCYGLVKNLIERGGYYGMDRNM